MPPSLRGGDEVGPVGGHISVGAVATLLSSHAGRSFTPDAGTTAQRQPEGGRRKMSQTPGDPEPTTAPRYLSRRHAATRRTHTDTETQTPPKHPVLGCFCVSPSMADGSGPPRSRAARRRATARRLAVLVSRQCQGEVAAECGGWILITWCLARSLPVACGLAFMRFVGIRCEGPAGVT